MCLLYGTLTLISVTNARDGSTLLRGTPNAIAALVTSVSIFLAPQTVYQAYQSSLSLYITPIYYLYKEVTYSPLSYDLINHSSNISERQNLGSQCSEDYLILGLVCYLHIKIVRIVYKMLSLIRQSLYSFPYPFSNQRLAFLAVLTLQLLLTRF